MWHVGIFPAIAGLLLALLLVCKRMSSELAVLSGQNVEKESSSECLPIRIGLRPGHTGNQPGPQPSPSLTEPRIAKKVRDAALGLSRDEAFLLGLGIPILKGKCREWRRQPTVWEG
ncbi:predicted protein [Chaetomium globosum CBS 148.51]|uniref:Uncharacterized protein n=1 Tax=Chaetomium globosum (strain ATCC 6205 / CBS 148.51 / DSM 1962 / NBRC 6347 / NRRL 1970) TaxID=306901 RepID=Q2GXK3_CHAGB|nr:uncharacterized protein CHGG_07301 [Chaetomium globosum CBS 148.51]EAQ86048.1 predicted protein [Chaetomium globosum CBS 148.51]